MGAACKGGPVSAESRPPAARAGVSMMADEVGGIALSPARFVVPGGNMRAL